MKSIIIIGYMGAGKTTVGKALAKEKVKAGFTPNPDVMCNRLIKFGAFDEKMGHNYDLIATGHYAQTETDENGDKWLVTSPDPVKDQTDFLAQIESWQLKIGSEIERPQ